MSAKHHPTGSSTENIARLRQLLITNILLASVFALLVAASYTGVAAAVVTITMATAVVGLVATRLTNSEGVRVPGTDICLRTAS